MPFTIPNVKAAADGTLIDTITGKITDVQQQKQLNGAKGPTTVQGFKLSEGRDFIFVDVWAHPDITEFDGKTVTIRSTKSHAGKFGGVTVKDKQSKDGSKTYKNLSISSLGTISTPEADAALGQLGHTPDAHKPTAAAAVARQTPAPAPKPAVIGYAGSGVIHGATVGAAINNAVSVLLAEKKEVTKGAVWKIASDLVRVAQQMEAGKLHGDEPKQAPAHDAGEVAAANAAADKYANVDSSVDESDPPF